MSDGRDKKITHSTIIIENADYLPNSVYKIGGWNSDGHFSITNWTRNRKFVEEDQSAGARVHPQW